MFIISICGCQYENKTVNVTSNKMSIIILDRQKRKSTFMKDLGGKIACQSWNQNKRKRYEVRIFHESLHSIADIKRAMDLWLCMHANDFILLRIDNYIFLIERFTLSPFLSHSSFVFFAFLIGGCILLHCSWANQSVRMNWICW